MKNKIYSELVSLYGEQEAESLLPRIEDLIKKHSIKKDSAESADLFDEKDGVVITYGNSVQQGETHPLRVLRNFLEKHAGDAVKGVHVLPYFPYSSDDGFSIIDYRKVNPDLGDWSDIEALSKSFMLMSDLVLNHCSQESPWMKSLLAGDLSYSQYFISPPEDADLSMVARPRTSPLLHEYKGKERSWKFWTTFSEDQVDVNFANPQILLEFTDILLLYLEKGSRIVRLDAIAYLWKTWGTSCIHLPRTHAAVRYFRALMDYAAPGSILITETNVPHQQNMSYLGNGKNEAHMVYQFSLPPLTLDAFLRGDSTHLTSWAAGLPLLGKKAGYFNFLASHDGIGMLPAHGILTDGEMDNLISVVKERGGRVSYKNTETGPIPYELNINYLSAVAEQELPVELRARKFLASQSILLSLPGIPGIYIHSLLGSTNWSNGPEITGINRSINREKLQAEDLEIELADKGSLRSRVLTGYLTLLKTRSNNRAFHPAGGMNVVDIGKSLFCIVRTPPKEHGPDELNMQVGAGIIPVSEAEEITTNQSGAILVIINVTGKDVPIPVQGKEGSYTDLLTGEGYSSESILSPWQTVWLKSK